ncbi:hypothetical protein C0J52_07104 [Blattella germanica]|nr:hypothetical protein C0J52_07104 [Blattella germanica]
MMDASQCNASGTDDVFANSSTETVVENIDFSLVLKQGGVLTNLNGTCRAPEVSNMLIAGNELHVKNVEELPVDEVNKENSSLIANCLISRACNFLLKLYCPFCCSHYTSQTMLKGHLKDNHSNHLEIISSSKSDPQTYFPHMCHFCHACFHTTDILVKHVLQNHQDHIIALFEKKIPNEHIMCGFCPYEILTENKQQLIIHIEENHLKEFSEVVVQKSKEELKLPLNTKDNISMSTLNNLLMQMSTNDTSQQDGIPNKNLQKSSLRVINSSNKTGAKNKTVKMVRFQLSEPTTRRRLSFKLQDRDLVVPNKENIISCSSGMRKMTKYVQRPIKVQKQSKWKTVFSFGNKRVTSDKQISKLVTSTPDALKTLHIGAKKKIDLHKKRENENKDNAVYRNLQSNLERTEHKTCNKPDILGGMEVTDGQVPSTPKIGVQIDPTTTWTPPEESFRQYKCAICLLAFVNNIDLISHARQRHSGPLKLLQPPFKCGQCEAKFYKNSFLLRHCKYHHTPRCLKNKLPA